MALRCVMLTAAAFFLGTDGMSMSVVMKRTGC